MLVKFFAILIPLYLLMDFIGSIPIFTSLTADYSSRRRFRAAILASFVACTIVFLFAILGQKFLQYFTLSLSALKVGGGLMLIYIAFEMVFPGNDLKAFFDRKSVIVTPIAVPMLAGPGSMSLAMISYIDLIGLEKLLLLPIMMTIFILGVLTLSFAGVIKRFIGREFVKGLNKLIAIFLVMIAAEMILSGIKLYFF